jgi:glutathione S-transferase
MSNLRQCYGYLEAHLVSREYLANDRYSVADAYLFTVTNWAAIADFSLTEFPEVSRFQSRISARPAVRQAMKAEGLT